ncbi:hypothetical protein F5Y00DRAFT_255885 [Daldinia vernicosa]|uniref:uncharacterized protein n=1 Tax=Daldinia vernicosa TaxID=114800 RepID=UPI0020086F12|nr:uncharacterized protein F5Y00DRAFT_255885 [Daldinia vernicosa]KAI0844579.1 hypothetical protein F5Y00DRAFT_255885 [Daldinia vernicosa]
MAGIVGSQSDSTCNTHNALRNISISSYACGVTFGFKSTADPPPDMHYGVVSLKECCDMANRPLMRIPGNTGCEMQFCELPESTTSTTKTIGPPGDVDNCMRFVYERDVPESVAKDIAFASSWCIVRMYDDELPDSEVSAAVTAAPAPPSWTTAAMDQFDVYFSTKSAAEASATAAPKSSDGPKRYAEQSTSTGVKIWAVVALATLGLVAAL